MKKPDYDVRTDALLDLLPGLTGAEFARLAVACADQAGMRVNEQKALERKLADGLGLDTLEVAS